MLLECPNCQARHEIVRAGRYRCPGCEGPFEVSQETLAAAASPEAAGPVAPAAPPAGAAGPPAAATKAPARAGEPRPADPTEAGESASPEPAISAGVAQRLHALDAALRAEPGNRVHYFKLAQGYADAGLKDRAVAVLQTYLQVEPGNDYAKQRIAALTRQDRVQRTASAAAPVVPVVALAPKVEDPARVARRRKRLLIGAAAVLSLVLAFVAKRTLFPSTWPVSAGEVDAHAPLWSPDGRQLAYLSSGGLHVFDVAEGASRHLVARESRDVSGHAWSPDSRRLAFVAPVDEEGIWEEGVHVVEVATGEVSFVALGEEPVWGADSMTLVLRSSGRSIEEVRRGLRGGRQGLHATDTFTRDMRLLAPGDGGGARPSPAGDWVVFTAGAQRAEDPDAEWEGGDSSDPGEFAETVLSSGADSVGSVNRAMDAEASARMREEGAGEVTGPSWWPPLDLHAVPASGGEAVALTADGYSCSPRWDAEGGRILFLRPTEEDPQGAAVWAVRPDGTGLARLTRTPFRTVDLDTARLAPDGRRVYFERKVEGAEGMAEVMARTAGTDIYVLKASGGEPKRLANRHAFKQSFSISADGERLAYEVVNSDSGRGEIWVEEL